MVNKLYQTAIKAHSSSPIGRDRKIEATHFSEGYNASCGDEIDFSLALNPSDGKLDDISFKDDSCAICTASASILCDMSTALNKNQVYGLYLSLLSILGCKNDPLDAFFLHSIDFSSLKEPENSLVTLAPVAAHPSRINCALLPWQTVLAAFDKPVKGSNTSEPSISKSPAAITDNA